MKKPGLLLCLIVSLVSASCGKDSTLFDPNLATQAQSVTVTTSTPTLTSGSAETATITVTVLAAGSLPLAGVEVTLTADTGTLTNAGPLVTDATGTVVTTLGAGADPTNRTITVTATQGALGNTVTVDVVGTTLGLTGPAGLPNGGTGTFSATLLDGTSNGVAGATVDLLSDNGNTLSAASVVTDGAGLVQFQVTAVNNGTDTISASTLGLVAMHSLQVTDEIFVITAPASGAQVDVNTNENVSLTWTVAGAPQVGQTIIFSTTRGLLSSSSADTDAAGVATVTISSAEAGPALVTATNSAGTAAEIQFDFVAPVVAPTGGSTKPSATSEPMAVQSSQASTGLQSRFAINLATENVVAETSAGYEIGFTVQVTDSQGNAMSGVAVQAAVEPTSTLQGQWHWYADAERWAQSVTAGPCAVDESLHDLVTLSWIDNVTDQNGRASLVLGYPKDYGRWVNVALTVTSHADPGARVSQEFRLPIRPDDTASRDAGPPGQYSPFGTATSCSSNY